MTDSLLIAIHNFVSRVSMFVSIVPVLLAFVKPKHSAWMMTFGLQDKLFYFYYFI